MSEKTPNKESALHAVEQANGVKGGTPQAYALIAIAEAVIYLADVIRNIGHQEGGEE